MISGIAFLFLCPTVLVGQVVSEKDSVQKNLTDSSTFNHSPKKAALYSLMVPGLGQIYNKKYWKVPLIYAGLVGLGLNIGYNQQQFSLFREEYIFRVTHGNEKLHVNHREISNTTTQNLPVVQDTYRKNRDLFVIGTLAFYVLNIVDASVDAHLFDFDVSEDLSLNVSPDINYCFASRQTVPSVSFKLKF